jgi:hypothetical protein
LSLQFQIIIISVLIFVIVVMEYISYFNISFIEYQLWENKITIGLWTINILIELYPEIYPEIVPLDSHRTKDNVTVSL